VLRPTSRWACAGFTSHQARSGSLSADDMGLGKTIQVLSLLLILKRQDTGKPQAEPAGGAGIAAGQLGGGNRTLRAGLKALIAHPSALPAAELKAFEPARLHDIDLVITSYGSLLRVHGWRTSAGGWPCWMKPRPSKTRCQTDPRRQAAQGGRQVGAHRHAGRERLGDLWSIFDFVNPGLLGTAKQFTGFAKRLAERPHGYGPLRELVRPYILRRLKTDRR